jgi:hypothetical protein
MSRRADGKACVVAQMFGGRDEVADQSVSCRSWFRHRLDRVEHVVQPSITLVGTDKEWKVSHPKSGVSTLVAVGRRTAPILDEKES